MNGKTKLLKQREIEEDNRTYEEILQEVRDLNEGTASEYVPKLCTALKRKNPLISAIVIRATVIRDLCPTPWKESTIRLHWPDWMKNPKVVEAGRLGGKRYAANIKTRKIAQSNIAISQNDLDKEEEQSPVNSKPIWEYEEDHPKTEKTPFQALGEINRSISRLWTALTGNSNMAHMEDNIKAEHVIPTRGYFKDIINGSSKVERDFLFNWLTYLNQVIVDRLDLIEKSDKTAYDTRE